MLLKQTSVAAMLLLVGSLTLLSLSPVASAADVDDVDGDYAPPPPSHHHHVRKPEDDEADADDANDDVPTKPRHNSKRKKKHRKKGKAVKPKDAVPEPHYQKEGEGLKLDDPHKPPVDDQLLDVWKKQRKQDCKVPGRQYLRAEYIGNRVWSNYAKMRLGTGFYVLEYEGGEADDSYKDRPLVVGRSDAGWMASGGKEFVFRDLEYGGKAWLRTGQAGGKCAGFNGDHTEIIMWRCNHDGTYPEFFYTEEVQKDIHGAPWYVDTHVYFRNGQDVYRPFIQVMNPQTNGTKVLLDKCDVMQIPSKATPKIAEKPTPKPNQEQDQAVMSEEAAKDRINQGEIVDPADNYNRFLYGAHEIETAEQKEQMTELVKQHQQLEEAQQKVAQEKKAENDEADADEAKNNKKPASKKHGKHREEREEEERPSRDDDSDDDSDDEDAPKRKPRRRRDDDDDRDD